MSIDRAGNNNLYLKNAWYVAGRSSDVGRALRPAKVLGEEIVLYRTEDGSPVALEDACPHRKLPLSKGALKGDVVECGYHGLTFDRTGGCVRAPTQDGSIPKRAVVRSYPVVDRWNLLWIWMGDPEKAEPATIFDVPNFDSADWGLTALGSMDVACNYLWVVDNLLDPSHVAWVHVSSFAGAGTESEQLQVDVLDDGVIVWRWMYDRDPPPYYANLVGFEGKCDRKQHYECRLPGIAVNKSIFAPSGTGGPDRTLPPETFMNISYNFMTPVDDDHTAYFWFQHYNMPRREEVSAKMFEGAKMAFLEDRDVLEAVHRGMKDPATPFINLGLDAGAMRFRRLLERRVEAEGAGGSEAQPALTHSSA